MKSTERFKQTISEQLEIMAAADPMFAASLRKEGKNIDNCITYILNTVQKSGCNGFTDDEIFGMAAHYYDEDNIEVGKSVNCNVIINHQVALTPDEIEEAKRKAAAEVKASEVAKLKTQTQAPAKKIKLTPKEKEEAKKIAYERILEEERKRLKSKRPAQKEEVLQPTLF